ncbi:MAG TPA: hypothetical protein VJ600_03215 [Holophagaceae bacterium]|nr:hypothetical protein [Holophagaceae bacterium]
MNDTFRVVNRLDHLMVESLQPEPLFRVFTEAFGLPVAWPFDDYGELWSGGVVAGNVNLEFCRFKERRFGKADAWENGLLARFGGLAFEPSMPVTELAGQLSGLGLAPGAGHATENWTDLEVKGLLEPPGLVFLSEYAFDAAAWRAQQQEAFREAGGGHLGLWGVQELSIGVRDLGEAQAWAGLLGGLPAVDQGAWLVGEGLTLRLVPWGKDEITGLTLRVGELEPVLALLEQAGYPCQETLAGVYLNPQAMLGLRFQLVDGDGT